METQTILFGLVLLIIVFVIGFFIYLRPKGPGEPEEPEEPEEPGEPSIKLMESSAILNPDAKQDTIEGYTIEYSSGDTYTNEELTDYVNIKIKWNNLGGFSMVRRLKLTLENGFYNFIEPSKVFTKTNTSESKYFKEITYNHFSPSRSQTLEYTFVGKNVTSGVFIGTIKPVFEYSVSDSGEDYRRILLSNTIKINVAANEITLGLKDGISSELVFAPIISNLSDTLTDISVNFDNNGYVFRSRGNVSLNNIFDDELLYVVPARSNVKGEIHLRTSDKWVRLGGQNDLSLDSSYDNAYIFKISSDPGYISDHKHIILQSQDESKILVYETARNLFFLKPNNSFLTPDEYKSIIFEYRREYVSSFDSVKIKFVDDDDRFLSFETFSSPASYSAVRPTDGNSHCRIIESPTIDYISPVQPGVDYADKNPQKSHTADNAGFFDIFNVNLRRSISIPHPKSSVRVPNPGVGISNLYNRPSIIVKWKDTDSYFFRVNDRTNDYAVRFYMNNLEPIGFYDYSRDDGGYPNDTGKYIRFQIFDPHDTNYKNPLKLRF